ncbi:MAG TPA: DUF1987 domain-containing protein [Bacteroidia bacterium]|nr:DUF1987 domain-containing protein [Bacteroidia bacterium]
MELFFSEQTAKTPFIQFNPNNGVFEMKGKSIPENSKVFYTKMFEWLDNYIAKPSPNTTLDIQLDYFNTSSAKCVIDLFKKLETIQKNGLGKVIINWHYNEDDGDMQEAGQDYQSIVKVTFNLISFIQ